MQFFVFLFKIFLFCLPFIILALIFREIYYYIKVRLVDRLVYVREFDKDTAFEGDEVEIVETITNPSMLPVFFVDVESYIHGSLRVEGYDINDGMQLIFSRFHLPPYTKVTRRFKVKCAHRGYYTMNTAVILSKSITIERTKNYNFNSELYVYPKLIDRRDNANPCGTVYGESLTARRVVNDPFSVSGVRDYAFGDPFNSINFKATARSCFGGRQSIKVNNYEYCSDRVFMIYLNFLQSDEKMSSSEYSTVMESALSYAASVARDALKNGYKVGFAANCRMVDGRQSLSFPILGGAYHIEELLREMAKIRIDAGGSFVSLLDGGVKRDVAGAELFIMTQYLDDDIDNYVALLKRKNNVTVMKL